MKNLGNTVVVVGFLLFVYAVMARFVDAQTIGYGLVTASSQSGIIVANSLMLIGIIIKQWDK